MFSRSYFDLQMVVLIFAILDVVLPRISSEECRFSMKRNTEKPYPFLLKPSALTQKPHEISSSLFVYPDRDGFVDVAAAGRIAIICGKSHIALGERIKYMRSQLYTCMYNETFQTDRMYGMYLATTGEMLMENISDINCMRYDGRAAQGANTTKTCLNKYTKIALGVQVEIRSMSFKFAPLIQICYDFELQRALYSLYTLTKHITGGLQPHKRRHFISAIEGSDFYFKQLYKEERQRRCFNFQTYIDDLNSTEYINKKENRYLVRGHLTPREGFVYAVQQQATFYYENTAPQWQSFNNGNWNILERAVRSYASEKEVDLQVYTGTHGVMTLPNHVTDPYTNVMVGDVTIELYDNINVPVPELFWKVVYEPISKAGVAFIGINNPYINETSTICTDICDDLSYEKFRWKNRKDIASGYCYCCSVTNFRKTVDTLPSFKVTKLLGA